LMNEESPAFRRGSVNFPEWLTAAAGIFWLLARRRS
jgi:hypothetical protein